MRVKTGTEFSVSVEGDKIALEIPRRKDKVVRFKSNKCSSQQRETMSSLAAKYRR